MLVMLSDKKLVIWITNRTPSHDSNDKLQLLPTKLLHYGLGKSIWRINQVSNYCFGLCILQSNSNLLQNESL